MPSILNATTSSGLVTSADNSGSLQLATNNGTTAVTIDTSQNVGIGTASPSVKLQVERASNCTAYVRATGGATTALYSDGSTGWVYTQSNHPLILGTNDAERMRLDTSGNLQFNSGYGSVATAYGCRAWVNFNGTGTIAIRASGNVSSLTDNGQGDYTVNFTSSMPDANYSVGGVTSKNANTNTGVFISSQATSNVRVLASVTDGLFDQPTVCVNIFR